MVSEMGGGDSLEFVGKRRITPGSLVSDHGASRELA